MSASADKAVPCCGNGLCDGMEAGSSCPADCKADHESLVLTSSGLAANSWLSGATYTWTPMHGSEGRSLLRCFEGVTNAGSNDVEHYSNVVVDMRRTSTTAPTFCMVFNVVRCSYCVPEYATMKSIAVHYLKNVDWLRVYNSNPGVQNPDVIIFAQDAVTVGPLYQVQRGDTLLSVAAMAKTTLKTILQVNADLAVTSSSELEAGQEICLLLCSSMPIIDR
jgi:hypothetical protein